MKKLLTALLSLLMVFGLVGCGGTSNKTALERIKEQGYIVFGTSPDYAPMEFYIAENGEKKMVGVELEMAQYFADYLGVELEVQPYDFNTVIANAQAGTVDFAMSGFAWTKERDGVVDFSNHFERTGGDNAYQGLMVRKEDVAKYPNKEAFKASGATVGAQAASIQYDMAKTIADEENIVQLADTGNVAAQLSIGDLDAFVCTSTQALALMETYDNIVLLPQETFDMDPDNVWDRTGAIFSKDESFDTLIEEFNKCLEEITKVDPETGKSLFDQWYNEAEALLPFDLTKQLIENGEL